MIKKLKLKLRKSNESGLFHDSRKDINTLMKVYNEMHDKINELINEVNNIKHELDVLKQNNNEV